MSWLYKILGGVISNAATKVISWLTDFIVSYFYFKKEKKENEKQAGKVQTVADKIKELIKNGQTVPEELKEQLREESRRLVDGTFDPNGGK